VLLASIVDLGGAGTKDAVLNNIAIRRYLYLLPEQLELKQNRNEQVWRNDLAFIRKHLVLSGDLDGSRHNWWKVTEKGREHFQQLSEKVMASLVHQGLTAEAVERAELGTWKQS
jgi:hypothetical protein